jgi:hypothetical protein
MKKPLLQEDGLTILDHLLLDQYNEGQGDITQTPEHYYRENPDISTCLARDISIADEAHREVQKGIRFIKEAMENKK